MDSALGVDDAPGGSRRVGHLEILRDAENALAVLPQVRDGSGIGLRSGEHRGLVMIGVVFRKRRACDELLRGDSDTESTGDTFHFQFSCCVFLDYGSTI